MFDSFLFPLIPAAKLQHLVDDLNSFCLYICMSVPILLFCPSPPCLYAPCPLYFALSLLFSLLHPLHFTCVTSQRKQQRAGRKLNNSAFPLAWCKFAIFGKLLPGCFRFISHQDGSNLGEPSVTNNRRVSLRSLAPLCASREDGWGCRKCFYPRGAHVSVGTVRGRLSCRRWGITAGLKWMTALRGLIWTGWIQTQTLWSNEGSENAKYEELEDDVAVKDVWGKGGEHFLSIHWKTFLSTSVWKGRVLNSKAWSAFILCSIIS